jgi:MFS family permease
MEAQHSQPFYGWKLLAALWCIVFVNLAFPTYGTTVVNAYMATDLHMDRKTLGSVFSLYMIMSGLPGPLVAVYINKVGPRITLIGGSLLLLTGSLLMALVVHTGWQAVLVFGLIIGSGVLMGGTLASQTCAAFWFVRRRALALSIMYSAASIGGFVAAPLLNKVIAASGNNWRMAWWLIAGLICFSTLIAALFIKNKPGDIGQLPDGGPEIQGHDGGKAGAKKSVYITTDNWTFMEALRSPVLWLLMLCGIGMSGGFTLFMGQGVVHLQDLGHTPALAAMSISIMVFGNFGGKIIVGALGDIIEPRLLWAAAMFIFSLGLALVVHAQSVAVIYAFAICLGIGFGSSIVLVMTLLGNYFGTTAFASISGLALAVQTSVSAVMPFIGGYMYDTQGSYASTFYGLAILCFAGATLLLFVRPPVK